MTERVDIDRGPPLFPDLGTSGLRVTRAQFAVLMGTSRQTVSVWVRKGWITLGSDNRCDPRAAVAELLRHADPTRVRARVLEPLTRELEALRKRVVELEGALTRCREKGEIELDAARVAAAAKLASCHEDVEFHEGAANELAQQMTALEKWLCHDRDELTTHPASDVVDAIIHWVRLCIDGRLGVDISYGIMNSLDELSERRACSAAPPAAPTGDTEGEGETR